jgi:4-hydroxybenzoate polyprenyltransferase
MMKYLQIIRLPNLIIIPFVQYCMRFCIIKPLLQINGFELQLTEIQFFILVLSTVMLAAAGYIINDYFDLKIDLINKPQSVIVSKSISRRTAMVMHIVFNVIGIVLGLYLVYIIKIYVIALVYFVVAGLFWYYSTTYKRQFLVGNIVVAFLTALVPLQVILYEVVLLNMEYRDFLLENNYNFNSLFIWVLGFAVFAFLLNLIREIVKDIEDFEGDNAFGRDTMPVIIGIISSKVVVIVLAVFTIVSLFYVYYNFLFDKLTLYYIIFLLVLPFLIFVFLLFKAKTKKQYSLAGNLLKIIMLFGVSYAFLARYLILENL